MLLVRTVDRPKRRAVSRRRACRPLGHRRRSGWSPERARSVAGVNLTHDYLFILSVAAPMLSGRAPVKPTSELVDAER